MKYTIDCTDNQAKVLNECLKRCGFGHAVMLVRVPVQIINETPEYKQGWKDRELKAKLDAENVETKHEHDLVAKYEQGAKDYKRFVEWLVKTKDAADVFSDCESISSLEIIEKIGLANAIARIDEYDKIHSEVFQDLMTEIKDLVRAYGKEDILLALEQYGFEVEE